MTDSCSREAGPSPPENPSRFEPGPGKHVLFFGDPMCSWCWGFAPELRRLAVRSEGHAAFHVIMGGLRPGTQETWDEAMRSYIRHHWEDVHAKTGQPFDFTRFEDRNFVYDTEPACRAVVCVRDLAPDHTLAFYDALQRAFYAEAQDITDLGVLTDIAVATGLDSERFRARFLSPDARDLVAFDFQRTLAFGVQGFPSVVCAEDGQYAFLALGYRPYKSMQDDFEAWLGA